MFCKNCGEALNNNQAICLKCGVKVGDGNMFCPNCGKPVDPNGEYCMACGVALKKSAGKGAAGDFAGKEKLTIFLVCLFLGGFGIHNFMMGETKKGIIKIVTTLCFGIGGILALIDLVKIAIDTYVVDPNKFI